MAEFQERVGRRIREAREAKRWSQARLAHALPKSKKGEPRDGSQVSRWERGKVMPEQDTLEALARALEVDVAYFMAEERSVPSAPALGEVLGEDSQLDRIEGKLNRLLACLLTPEQRRGYEELEALAAELEPAPGHRQRRTSRA